jgi:hypothetical protein
MSGAGKIKREMNSTAPRRIDGLDTGAGKDE